MISNACNVIDSLDGLKESLVLACDWLMNKSMLRTMELPPGRYRHAGMAQDWRGAFRGEYSVARKEWNFMCPAWHGGQAVKALALAYQVTGDSSHLDASKLGADFLLRCQDTTGDDSGLIHAYEDHEDKINTSALLESLDGLFVLAKVSGGKMYQDAAVAAGRWALKKAWVKNQGIVKDLYDPQSKQFIDPAYVTLSSYPGRPLADDAVWLTCQQVTGERAFGEAFYDVLDCLLRTENPSGNWVGYGPCLPELGLIHPRHAYWWGMPMVAAWHDTGRQVYLDCARRCGQWYLQAQRVDGGMFRYTDLNYNTACFGHATSGTTCAAALWIELWETTRETCWLEPIHRALKYAMELQFTKPADENLRGCILEKVLPPDGTDASPYQIRDLATIFYIQAVAKLLLIEMQAVEPPNLANTSRGATSTR